MIDMMNGGKKKATTDARSRTVGDMIQVFADII